MCDIAFRMQKQVKIFRKIKKFFCFKGLSSSSVGINDLVKTVILESVN